MAHKCDGCRYKGEHQEMMFRPFGVCTKETNLVEAEKSYNAEQCPYKTTNADRIRAMSDEELAEWLGDHLDCINCPVGLTCVHGNGCPGSLVDWLKQPAE